MDTNRISARGQITIPSSIRRALGWKPGRQLEVVLGDGEVALRPLKTVAQLEGIFHRHAARRKVSWWMARSEMEKAVGREARA